MSTESTQPAKPEWHNFGTLLTSMKHDSFGTKKAALAVLEWLPVLILACGAFFATRRYGMPTDSGKLREVLGISLGALATLFAFMAGTAILLFQQVSNMAPTSMRHFPVPKILAVLSYMALLLIGDGILYATMGQDSPLFTMPAFVLILLHALAATVTVYLVRAAAEWFTPQYTIKRVRARIQELPCGQTDDSGSGQTQWDFEVGELLEALNELVASVTTKRYVSAVPSLFAAYDELVSKFPAVADQHVVYPYTRLVRRVTQSIGQFGVNLLENDLDTFAADTAYLFLGVLADKHLWLHTRRSFHVLNGVLRLDDPQSTRDGDNGLSDTLLIAMNRVVTGAVQRGLDSTASSFIRKCGRCFRVLLSNDSTNKLYPGDKKAGALAQYAGEFYLSLVQLGVRSAIPTLLGNVLYDIGELLKGRHSKEIRRVMRECANQALEIVHQAPQCLSNMYSEGLPTVAELTCRLRTIITTIMPGGSHTNDGPKEE